MLCKGSGLNCPYLWHASYGLIISDDWDWGNLPKDIQRWFVLTFEVSTRITIKSINNNTNYYIYRIYRLQPYTRWTSMNYCIVSEWSDFRSKKHQAAVAEMAHPMTVELAKKKPWNPLIFPGFPMVFHPFSWFSYGFSSIFLIFLWFLSNLPAFPFFNHFPGFPMVFVWLKAMNCTNFQESTSRQATPQQGVWFLGRKQSDWVQDGPKDSFMLV